MSTFSTLDGVMQAPGGAEEDDTGAFRHGGWSVHYSDDRMRASGQPLNDATTGSFA
ncbi:MAG TPA: hypothetical protein VM688_01085 [Nocardioidaceae bacterium]|nr:hypothetical protein [Nocardioidaceae bacterium]